MWRGSLGFGLVLVPVRLYPATESKRVRFHQVRKGSRERVRNRRVGGESREDVAYEDVQKGYEIPGGRHVVVTAEELAAAAPEQNHTIAIEQFVELAQIDPIVWNHSYYVGPETAGAAAKSYALLLAALRDTARVAIGRFVLRKQQHLVSVRPYGRALLLQTLWYADEVRGLDGVEHLPMHPQVKGRELTLARQLIESMSGKWQHETFHDTQRAELEHLIQRKAHGEESAPDEPTPVRARANELAAALEQSLALAPRRSARKGTRHGRRKRARRKAS